MNKEKFDKMSKDRLCENFDNDKFKSDFMLKFFISIRKVNGKLLNGRKDKIILKDQPKPKADVESKVGEDAKSALKFRTLR